MRARPLRLVSALMRLDLPTLERPANATSIGPGGGKASTVMVPAMKRHSCANSQLGSVGSVANRSALLRREWLVVALRVPGLIRPVQLPHDVALLQDRERVVPGPIDHQADGV